MTSQALQPADDLEEFYDGEPVVVAEPPSSPAAVHRVLEEVSADLDGPEAPELPAERERTTRTPGFARMPVGWTGQNAGIVASINAMAKGRIESEFADLFELLADIETEARDAGTNRGTGEIGRPDYSAIHERQKESWFLELAVRLAGWRQRAAAYWGEAMMAKVMRQEAFTTGYLAKGGRTVEDRTQAGHEASLQEYYHAILCALLAKHADAACNTAELIGQRLKDSCGR